MVGQFLQLEGFALARWWSSFLMAAMKVDFFFLNPGIDLFWMVAVLGNRNLGVVFKTVSLLGSQPGSDCVRSFQPLICN